MSIKKYILFFSPMLLLVATSLRAQDTVAKPYTFTAYLQGGYVRNVDHFDHPIEGIQQNGTNVNLRILWHPEHLLAGGLEVGLSHVYTVKQNVTDTSGAAATLDATINVWPILFVFSMSPVQNFNVLIGFGPSISESVVESFGNRATSSEIGSSMMAGVNYIWPVSDNVGIGGEFKYLRVNKYENHDLLFNITFAWKFLEY
jgi:hypothetical protein